MCGRWVHVLCIGVCTADCRLDGHWVDTGWTVNWLDGGCQLRRARVGLGSAWGVCVDRCMGVAVWYGIDGWMYGCMYVCIDGWMDGTCAQMC